MPNDNPTAPIVQIRDIPGRPGYRAGDDGSVWSCLTRGRGHWKIGTDWQQLRTKLDTNGYPCVTLNGRYFRVHRVVLETFVGPRPRGAVCRHLDGNPENNRLDNLCWGSKSENWRDACDHGVACNGENHPGAKMTESDVREARRQHETGHSIRSISRRLGVSHGTVRNAIIRKTWGHI